MIAIIITLSAFALLRFAAKSKKQAPVYAPIVPAGLERQRKEREKAAREAEKAEQARQLACMELDHIEAQRAQLMALYDALEAERDAADTAQTRKNTLTRQLVSLNDRLYKLDARRAKAFGVAYAA